MKYFLLLLCIFCLNISFSQTNCEKELQVLIQEKNDWLICRNKAIEGKEISKDIQKRWEPYLIINNDDRWEDVVEKIVKRINYLTNQIIIKRIECNSINELPHNSKNNHSDEHIDNKPTNTYNPTSKVNNTYNPTSKVNNSFEPNNILNDANLPKDILENKYNPMDSINIFHDVKLFPQPTGTSCWAAAATMIFGDRCVGQAKAEIDNEGYLEGDYMNIQVFARSIGLKICNPTPNNLDELAAVLTRSPLWVGGMVPSGHAYVISALSGDGTPQGTKMTIYDPWPPNIGNIKIVTYKKWMDEFPSSMKYILYK